MKKKILSVFCLLVLIVSLAACGNSAEATFGDEGVTAFELSQSCTNYASRIVDLSYDELQEYYDYYSSSKDAKEDYEIYETLFADLVEIKPIIGDFVGYTDFDVAKSGKTVTATLTIDYSKRDAEMVFVFNARDLEIQAINAQPVYSLGETMQKAALNTVMGIGIVFVILILISLIIYSFKIIPYLQKKLQKKEGPKVEIINANDGKTETLDDVNVTDDLELIAVISAAIAASTGSSTDSFVVRSIKRR